MSWLSCCLPIIIICDQPLSTAPYGSLVGTFNVRTIAFVYTLLSPADLRRMRSTCSFWRGDSHASLLLPSCYFSLQLQDQRMLRLALLFLLTRTQVSLSSSLITTLGIEEKDNLNSQKPMRNLWRRGTLRSRLVTSCSDPCSNSM